MKRIIFLKNTNKKDSVTKYLLSLLRKNIKVFRFASLNASNMTAMQNRDTKKIKAIEWKSVKNKLMMSL